jgi:hypothetical protein
MGFGSLPRSLPMVLMDGVFYFMAAAAVLLTLVAAGRSLIRAAPSHLEWPFEVLAPQAAQFAHDPLGFSNEPLSPDQGGIASDER